MFIHWHTYNSTFNLNRMKSLNGEPRNIGVEGVGHLEMMQGENSTKMAGSVSLRVINSGISAIGFNFLKDQTI